MSPDNERAWRREIRASVRSAKLALASLQNPAPAALASLEGAEDVLDVLSPKLSLVQVSPFDSLSHEPSADGSWRADSPVSGSRPTRNPGDGHGAAMTDAGWPEKSASAPQGFVREGQSSVTSTDGEPEVRRPDFSFRRAAGSGHIPGQGTQQNEQSFWKAPQVETGVHQAYARSYSNPGWEREDSGTVGSWEQEYGTMDPGSETAREARKPVGRDGPSESLPASGFEDMPEAQGRSGAGRRELGGERPSRREPPGRTTDDLTGPANKVPEIGQPGRPVAYPTESVLHTHGSRVMASINTLAERLMTDRLDTSGAGTGTFPMDQDTEATFLDGPEPALDGVDESVVRSLLDGEVLEEGSEPALDAETCADLVDEMLIRQARRHGVDLS